MEPRLKSSVADQQLMLERNHKIVVNVRNKDFNRTKMIMLCCGKSENCIFGTVVYLKFFFPFAPTRQKIDKTFLK